MIVDDDEKLRELLKKYLTQFGFVPRAAACAEDALPIVERRETDIVLLDVMLPAMNGFDALKYIKERSRVPVIMLTARGDTADRVLGLELGGDDYLPKPFDPRELVARVNAILRRGEPLVPGAPLEARDIRLDPGAYTAHRGGRALDLTAGEFLLLRELMGRPGGIRTREQLLSALSGDQSSAYDRSIDIMISRLRAKLGDDPKSPRFIRTVRGIGYVFLANEK